MEKRSYYKNKWNKKAEVKAPVYKPKRGTLGPLMKEEEKGKAGIHELSYDLAFLANVNFRITA